MGFWTAVPAAIVGVAMGHRTGVFRFLGYTDNGNPTLYPGYKEDQTRALCVQRDGGRLRGRALPQLSLNSLPAGRPSPLCAHTLSHLLLLAPPCAAAAYFVKHIVSDRHVAVAPRVALDDPTRFR